MDRFESASNESLTDFHGHLERTYLRDFILEGEFYWSGTFEEGKPYASSARMRIERSDINLNPFRGQCSEWSIMAREVERVMREIYFRAGNFSDGESLAGKSK